MILYKLFPTSSKKIIKDSFTTESPTGTIHYFSMEGCPHCIDFNPIFDRFEQEYEGQLEIKRTTVSETAMPPPDYQVNGYPAVVCDAPNGEITHFEGSRTVENLLAFASGITL